MDPGRLASRGQKRRDGGGLGSPFYIQTSGRDEMGRAKHRIIPTKVRYTDGPIGVEPTKSARTLRNKNKTKGIRKPKALRGMR